jgi:hypothetical protein
MKKGKNPNVLVLALEIAAIVVLHAIKINQTEKMSGNKEISRNAASVQTDSRITSSYTLAAFK